jgi:hypothetical protein
MITSHLGRCLRQFSAKFRPVTLPSLIHKVCRKIANRLDISTMKRCENLVAAPAKGESQKNARLLIPTVQYQE